MSEAGSIIDIQNRLLLRTKRPEPGLAWVEFASEFSHRYGKLELHYKQGRYIDAEPLYLRALKIREQQLGANHPDTAASLNSLASLYKSIGRYSDAEPLYVRAISILEQQLGGDHPNTQAGRDNLEHLRSR